MPKYRNEVNDHNRNVRKVTLEEIQSLEIQQHLLSDDVIVFNTDFCGEIRVVFFRAKRPNNKNETPIDLDNFDEVADWGDVQPKREPRFEVEPDLNSNDSHFIAYQLDASGYAAIQYHAVAYWDYAIQSIYQSNARKLAAKDLNNPSLAR